VETSSLQNDVLAVETHAGRVWSLLILPVLIVPVVSVFVYPTAPARFAMVLTALVATGALGLVLSGFQYRFLRHGVEVSTLGIPLRTIPRQQIVSYSIESWGLPRGYGIRGIGSSRAYVWGNKVVHIKTTNGDVYLGHSDPEKIVWDLNQVTGFVTNGEGSAMTSKTAEFSQKESSGRGWHKALIGLMWVALVSTALNYRNAWDQLPARVAVHFDANWEPNGYTSKQGAVELGLGSADGLAIFRSLVAHGAAEASAPGVTAAAPASATESQKVSMSARPCPLPWNPGSRSICRCAGYSGSLDHSRRSGR